MAMPVHTYIVAYGYHMTLWICMANASLNIYCSLNIKRLIHYTVIVSINESFIHPKKKKKSFYFHFLPTVRFTFPIINNFFLIGITAR